jgi:predicted acylesterase/phospholipase RssA
MAESGDLCPTFVVANKSLHADTWPTILRSYRCTGANASKCAIWQAARATTAHPSFFKPIHIDIPPPGEVFVDGGYMYNNPSELVLREARKIWPTIKRFSLVSIGAGRQKSVNFVERSPSGITGKSIMSHWWRLDSESTNNLPIFSAIKNIGEACERLTMNSEMVHQRVLDVATSNDPDRRFSYHRLNVEQGMDAIGFEEYDKFLEIAAHSTAYLNEGEGESRKNKCVHDLLNPRAVECMYPH